MARVPGCRLPITVLPPISPRTYWRKAQTHTTRHLYIVQNAVSMFVLSWGAVLLTVLCSFIMSHESVWYSRPRTYGKGSRSWCVERSSHVSSGTNKCSVVTGERKHAGVIRKYGLNMSRQAFREKAADIGFVKVSALILTSGRDNSD